MTTEVSQPSRVEEDKRRVLYEGHFRLELMTLKTETFAGGMAAPVKREVLRTGAAVAVLLYDAAADRVVMVEQFRLGAYINQLPSSWLLECVAGMVDDGEEHEVAARREVKEETGHDVKTLERVGMFLTSPGTTDESITLYIGSMDSQGVNGVHGQEDEGEDIRVRVMSADEAIAAADSGTVVNMIAQLALLWFARKREDIRARWLANGI